MSDDASQNTEPPKAPSNGTPPPKVTLTATVTTESAAPPAEPGAKTKPGDSIVTQHRLPGDAPFGYTVTTGFLPINNAKGETEARIFFMAYTKDDAGPSQERPLMFSFNGGPGSSSVWLHLGALGPKRVQLRADGSLPPPPYRLVDNPQSWLGDTDLVFIDPVGTGYSRPSTPELGKKFWGVTGDVEAMGEFIRLFLTRYKRWSSPLFLVGESYGTTRAAGLSDHLLENGIAMNGIALVSSVLDFQTIIFSPGNDLPYVLYVPSYAATAFYHKRLAPELQSDLAATLQEARSWSLSEYASALMRGNRLTSEERVAIAAQLARFTGLSPEFVLASDLRVEIHRFCKELLRSENRVVGRLDSRLSAPGGRQAAEEPDFDPSMATIQPPYTAVFNQYVRETLGFETDEIYHIMGMEVNEAWDWGKDMGYLHVSGALTKALAKNPYMKLFVASGYYDLATPFFATDYTIDHLLLDPELRANITAAEYEAGHMMYIHDRSLEKLARDIAAFIQSTINHDQK